MSVAYTWILPHDSTAPARGRWYVRELASSDVEAVDAELVVTELITNAWKHGHGDITLTVVVRDESLHVEVCSAADGIPRRLDTPDAVEATGRGLLMIEGLAERWGFERRDSHLCVWADVARIG